MHFVYECSVCTNTCKSEEGNGSHYRWLGATMWLVVGIEFRTSGKAVSGSYLLSHLSAP